jgi:DNA polymerase I-like protein with 3'-5' exonuclease and polymerase domains
MIRGWDDVKDIWTVDFEYHTNKKEGNLPVPVCYTAKSLNTGKILKEWITDNTPIPEYIRPNNILVAYNASAEMSCHAVLRWPRADYIFDPMVEYLLMTNGKPRPAEYNLYAVADLFDIDHPPVDYKAATRDRIIAGAPFTAPEREDILDYCFSDIDVTENLFNAMKSGVNLPQALFRGRYQWAIAMMTYYGIPVDEAKYLELMGNWEYIQKKIVKAVNKDYDVYVETKDGYVWSNEKFVTYINNHKIPWDYTTSGLPRLDKKYFSDMAKAYPKLLPLADAKFLAGQMRLSSFDIGDDFRNRAAFFPFKAITGRNAPSPAHFIFGAPAFIRFLIKPPVGWALAYLDYAQQEIAIAAKLSEDYVMQADYLTGDVYLSFGKAVGLLPQYATKHSHSAFRDVLKQALLGMNYGMEAQSLSTRANISLFEAMSIIKYHQLRYPQFHKWRADYLFTANATDKIYTPLAWSSYTQFYAQRPKKDLTKNVHSSNWLKNWPMQSCGSDILRLSTIMCLEAGIQVIAPVHDAILIQSPLEQLDAQVALAQNLMTEASYQILEFPIRTDAKIVKYPENYSDDRGVRTWNTIWEIIRDRQEE